MPHLTKIPDDDTRASELSILNREGKLVKDGEAVGRLADYLHEIRTQERFMGGGWRRWMS